MAHRQFANRAYFGFVCREQDSKTLLNEFRDFAELFRIGILAIVVSDSIFHDLLVGSDMQKTVSDMVDDEAVVQEIIPAPFQNVPIARQAQFLKNCGYDTKKKLFRLGMG